MTSAVRASRPWFLQAASDARTAEALLTIPAPMQPADVGCHVASFCAQAVEKSLKGYLLLNGSPPAMNHRPDKYLRELLNKDSGFLIHEAHYSHLAKLFDPATKGVIRELLDLTPGALGSAFDQPNTEYPWMAFTHRTWRRGARRGVSTPRRGVRKALLHPIHLTCIPVTGEHHTTVSAPACPP